MTDDFNKEEEDATRAEPVAPVNDGPEPPMRWNPANANIPQEQPKPVEVPVATPNRAGTVVIGSTRFELRDDEVRDFEQARRYMLAAQIIAVVSFFIGGVWFSGFALLCAFTAYAKLNRLASDPGRTEEARRALKRSGVITIAVAGVAFALNLLVLVVFYPYMQQILETGSLNGTSIVPNAGAPGSTTWG